MAGSRYDLVVIGAGAAGSTAASKAAEMGVRIAMVESDKLGGTCLNYGCDPTKTLLSIAKHLHIARHPERYGLRIPTAEADWAAVTERVQSVIEKIRGGPYEKAWAETQRKGIDLFAGEASFISPHELSVSGQIISADRVIIATGVEARGLDVEGLEEVGYITNHEAVSLRTLPERLAIVGGGPVGVEFAQMFSRFGVDVVVLQRGPSLLPNEDVELAEMLCHMLAAEGIQMETLADLCCVPGPSEGKRLLVRHGEHEDEYVVDEILVAVGRRPQISKLNLEAAGVRVEDERLVLDNTLRTTVPHIWAAGDVTGGNQFTHIASEQGEFAVRNAFASEPEPFDIPVVPWVTFTDPELAHVGKTEAQLRKENISYRIARMPLNKLDRAIAEAETDGMVKMLAGDKGEILGCHILAPGAGDLISLIVVAMKAGLTVDALAETVLPYPTMAEVVRWAADMLKNGRVPGK
jgi:pyruvate/2-oxoglutarate dehydrogenase complex dihydrolipoamide dehydrogenase (E3) component